MDYLTKIFQNPINANWAVAFGTIALAVVTIIYHFIGDAYTRLIKKAISYNFQKIAYEFLKTSFGSFDPKFSSPNSKGKNITVEECIDKFNDTLLSKNIYLTYTARRKANKYILLAKKLSKSFVDLPNSVEEVLKIQSKILIELEKLGTRIGKAKEVEALNKQHSKNDNKRIS